MENLEIEKSLICLDLTDRANLMIILPATGNRINMTLVAGIMDQVEFSADEISHFDIRVGHNGLVSWDPAKGPTSKDIFLSKRQLEICTESFNLANTNKSLNYKMIKLIDRFEAL